jgi:hypothetical protein
MGGDLPALPAGHRRRNPFTFWSITITCRKLCSHGRQGAVHEDSGSGNAHSKATGDGAYGSVFLTFVVTI